MSTPGGLAQILTNNGPIVIQFLDKDGSGGRNQFHTHDSLLRTWKIFCFDENKVEELEEFSKKGGIIKVTKRRIFRGMDLVIEDYEVLAKESPMITHENGLSSLTPEWYTNLVQVMGMVVGNKYNKKHKLYDSDSPPKLTPRKKQRKNAAYTCEQCGKMIKTSPAMKGHITKVHLNDRFNYNRLID